MLIRNLLFSLCLVFVTSFNVNSEDNNEQPVPITLPITLDGAEELVTDRIFYLTPNMDPAATFPLAEITTEEIWQRLKIQVFVVINGVRKGALYFIKDQEIKQQISRTAGSAVVSMAVTDLDQNGVLELVYTYFVRPNYMGQTEVAIYLEDENGIQNINSNFFYGRGDLLVKKIDDQNVYLEAPKHRYVFGPMKLKLNNGKLEFIVEPSSNLKIISGTSARTPNP